MNTKIPNTVTAIESAAFFNCTGLTAITIPASVRTIGSNVFDGCSGLTSIIVEEGNSKYDSRDNCNAIILTKNNRLIVGCKNTNIPENITKIESFAFAGHTGLTSITIPNSITSIGYQAFSDCLGLTKVICHATTPPSAGKAFESVNKGACILRVPNGSITAYQQADEWKEFAFIEGLETGIGNIKPNNGKSDAYSTDGRLIQRNADIKSLKKGLYIINGKKVMVR